VAFSNPRLCGFYVDLKTPHTSHAPGGAFHLKSGLVGVNVSIQRHHAVVNKYLYVRAIDGRDGIKSFHQISL
jgi:hypothetical protein